MVRLGLIGVCLLAFLLRALSFEGVFLDDAVLFAAGDSYAHARLALYAFVNLPSILTFDPYINYPEGAAVPIPPLQDFVVAALARATGDTTEPTASVVADGSYRVRAGDRTSRARVSEREVRSGATVEVDPSPSGDEADLLPAVRNESLPPTRRPKYAG